MAGSSLCSWNPPDLASSSGHPVTAAPGDPTEDVKKHTLDCLTLHAGSLAGLLHEAAAIQPICDNGSTAASSSCDATTVKAGSSHPDAATTETIEKKTLGDAVVKTVKTGSSHPPAAAVVKKVDEKKPGGKIANKLKGG